TDKILQTLNKFMEEILTEKNNKKLLTKILLETSDFKININKNKIKMFNGDQTEPCNLHNFFYEKFFTICNKHEISIRKYNIIGNILVLNGLFNTQRIYNEIELESILDIKIKYLFVNYDDIFDFTDVFLMNNIECGKICIGFLLILELTIIINEMSTFYILNRYISNIIKLLREIYLKIAPHIQTIQYINILSHVDRLREYGRLFSSYNKKDQFVN
ncbi:hypothetical protein COBT_004138, partial [Conglomerata obtusa]